MTTHLDLRLKNNSSFKINEKMGSMKQHAQKIANAYLWFNNYKLIEHKDKPSQLYQLIIP